MILIGLGVVKVQALNNYEPFGPQELRKSVQHKNIPWLSILFFLLKMYFCLKDNTICSGNTWGGGGFNPKKPKKTQTQNGISNYFGFFWVFWVFWGFLEKGVESTFLNIPDHLRPTCFLHFFKEISPSSDT